MKRELSEEDKELIRKEYNKRMEKYRKEEQIQQIIIFIVCWCVGFGVTELLINVLE